MTAPSETPTPARKASLGLRAGLSLLWRWAERALLLLVALGTGLAFGLRDGVVPLSSVVFYATPLPLLSVGAVLGLVLSRYRPRPRRTLLWAVLGLVLIGFTLQREWFEVRAERPVRDPIRVVSWNLQGGRAGQARIQAALAEFDGDLICLSEVGTGRDPQRGFVHELEAALRAKGYLARIWPRERLLVAIRAEGGQLGKQTWRPLEKVGGVLRVETHWRGRSLRVALTDFRSPPALDRRPGAEELLDQLRKGPEPWLCMGDFNTPSASRCFDPWREAGAEHAFETAGTGYAPTWPAPLPVLTLDHVWSRGLITQSASAPLRSESDHCPLLVVLGWSSDQP